MSHGFTRKSTGKQPIRTAARIAGVLFLIVGILGFIPGVTTDYYDLKLAGHESHAELFGLFQVSVLHNLVHLGYGVAGLALARTVSGSRLYFVGGGTLYLLIWIYGLIFHRPNAANFVPLNTADNWLHFGLGVVMIAIGLALTRGPEDRR